MNENEHIKYFNIQAVRYNKRNMYCYKSLNLKIKEITHFSDIL